MRVIKVLTLFLFATAFAADSSANLDHQTKQIEKELSCPICYGQSVAESQSVAAIEMKKFIRTCLQEGHSKKQIVQSLESVYGKEIVMEYNTFSLMHLIGIALYLYFGTQCIRYATRENLGLN